MNFIENIQENGIEEFTQLSRGLNVRMNFRLILSRDQEFKVTMTEDEGERFANMCVAEDEHTYILSPSTQNDIDFLNCLFGTKEKNSFTLDEEYSILEFGFYIGTE